MRFMQEDEALKAMSLFEEASESKKISKSCLKNWVVRIAFNFPGFTIIFTFFFLLQISKYE